MAKRRTAANYGSKILAARCGEGMTVRALAEAAGVSPSFISRLERGEIKDVGLSRAAVLCDILGLSLDELAGRR